MHATLPSPIVYEPSTLADELPALPPSVAAVPDAAASAVTHGEGGFVVLLQECLNACPFVHTGAESLPPADESRYRAAWKFGTLGQEHCSSGHAFVLLWKVSRAAQLQRQADLHCLSCTLSSSRLFKNVFFFSLSRALQNRCCALASCSLRRSYLQCRSLGPVVLHNDRSTASRLELTSR